MNSEWIIVVIVLLLIIAFQFYKLKKQAAVVKSVDALKDIFYWCDITPRMKYRFLSDSVDYQFGKGTKKLHYKQPELIFKMVHPEDRHLLEGKLNGTIDFRQPIVVRLLHETDGYYWFEEVSTPIYKNGQYKSVVGVYRRIDDCMKKFKEIEYELSYDKLTGVYNRSYFEKMMEYYNKQDVVIAMAIVDLDSLKLVNDRLGHRSGDEFISATAKILKNNATERISVCRIGGDEFAVFIENASEDVVNEYFNDVYEELTQQQQKVFLTNMQFSMGYGLYDSSLNKMQQLYEEADRNMYKNKRSKEMQVEFHI